MDLEQINNKILLIKEVVDKLRYFTQLYGIRSIFIAGGYCREYYLNKIWRVIDIDVASAYHEQARQLGGLFASEILNSVPKFYERTGTALVEYLSAHGNIKVEFQGDSINAYMHNLEVKTWMKKEGIDDVPLMNNIYGRDFTINALIYSLNDGVMRDPTERSVHDFERKKICSLLPSHLLIKYNPLAALRAIRFALQYGFFIDSNLRRSIKKGGTDNLAKSFTIERIIKEVIKILHIDPQKGLEMLKKFNLDRILLHPHISRYIDFVARKHPLWRMS